MASKPSGKSGAKSSKKAVDPGVEGFEFEEGGRVFTCSAEAFRSSPEDLWWWFRVVPDSRGQRYAPFRAAPDDTQENVRKRIVAYHDALLERRAQPAATGHWARRPAPAAAADAPESADAGVPDDIEVDLDVALDEPADSSESADSAEPAEK
jgi:hypothetical protein